jgi:hypothetical protein
VKQFTVILGLAALLGAACFTAEARRAPAPEQISLSDASESAVQVTASDYHYNVSTPRVKTGTVDFVVHNAASEQHEFVIVPRDGDHYGMPFGELEPIDAGQTHALRAQLAPGKYEFVCLIISVIDGGPKSHMSLGEKADFEVTQ